jgi:hypothetical protein
MPVLEILEMIYVMNNFLPFVEYEKIKLDLTNGVTRFGENETHWWKISNIVDDGIEDLACDPKFNFQLVHTWSVKQMAHHYELHPLTDAIEAKLWHRIKLNCNPCQETLFEHSSHTDLTNPTDSDWTAIYYLNTNNGYTKFEDGPTIESIDNRLVVFPAGRKHTGTNTTDTTARFVLNLNFKKDDVEEWATNWEESRAS